MSLYSAIKGLKLKRAKHTHDAGKILTLAKKEDRGLTPAEEIRFEKFHTRADIFKEQIDDMEANYNETYDPENVVEDRDDKSLGGGRLPKGDELKDMQHRCFSAWLHGSIWGLDERHQQVSKRMGLNPGPLVNFKNVLHKEQHRSAGEIRKETNRRFELRAPQTTTPGTGGEWIPPTEFVNTLEIALLKHGGMRSVATVRRSTIGNAMHLPTKNDTGNEGEIIDENTVHNEQVIASGELILGAFLYSSKIVKVPIQLDQDSAFDMNQLVGQCLGERIARITNRHYTVGTGSGEPNGIVTASSLGKTAAGVNSITFVELQDLKHSVDPAYRENGAGWMFNDTTFKIIKQLTDGQGRPLWQAGISVGAPDSLDGDPFTINQNMPQMTTGLKPVIYGDMSKYIIRDVRDFTLLVLRERYADFLQIGFLAFTRNDGDLLDAGTKPVKHLIMS